MKIVSSRQNNCATNLPDGVGVFAGLSRADVHRATVVLDQVIHGHVPVVESDGHQVRIVGVYVQRHYSAVRRIDVLRERWILQRVEQDHTRRLLHKLICNATENNVKTCSM